jgi:predicted PurR-regulated permease PerM|tara:strand:- start:1117 stop:1401 length:285 start_codon:yes stop_codon:yes gene_type:complete
MQTRFNELTEERPYQRYLCIALVSFVFFHIVMMAIVVAVLADIAPQMQTTMKDVNIMLPDMRHSLTDLGQMLPEIKEGLSVLQQLCVASPDCSL